jgi:predicted GNAT family N-acyltransferase
VIVVEVRRVSVDVVRPLRHAILRAGYPVAESVYTADDLAETVHLAAFDGDEVVGTATLFPEPYEGRPAWRLRGMAVADRWRGRGVGSLLLAEVVGQVRELGGELLWCNARTVALPFYGRHGFATAGEEFLVAHGVPHHVAVLDLHDAPPTTQSRRVSP